MKKLKIFATAIASLMLGATAASCDDMLETKNFTDMSPVNFFQSESDFDAAVCGLYVPLTTNWGYGDGGTGGWYNAIYCADNSAYLAAGMKSTDIMRSYATAGDEWEDFLVGPATGGALTSCYNVIRFVARATDIINQIENSNGATPAIRARYLAETKTLRAFYMYILLDFYGPVNVKLDPATLSDNTPTPRPDEATYVGYIRKDLSDALSADELPDRYNGDNANWGRMSKAVAWCVSLRVAMHQKDWTAAKEAAEKLMGMGYSLLPNYEDVFNISQNNEQIFSIPTSTAYDNFYVTEILPSDFKRGYDISGRSYIRGVDNSYFNGWQAYCMRWEFYDTFDDNDVRKRTILCSYDTQSGEHKERKDMPGPLPIKFMDTQFNSAGIQKDHPVVRYAEVLLCYAEAINELQGPAQALPYAKQVTDRAGIEIPAEAQASKDAFRAFLLAERGRELFCEGQRRQDQIRHGVYISSAVARGKNAKAHQVVYPIPQAAVIEADGVVEQNQGYTN
ncbi:MAG: RagB/SusD family nutrient uptake outer membrane protein [Clostridium sp.]|nr:RagB/SusD family nutrient uptake outer membrane protein [Clostridium sp.]